MAIFTFGYEGYTIDGFIARLKMTGVTVVSCRCRARKGSRKQPLQRRSKMPALSIGTYPSSGVLSRSATDTKLTATGSDTRRLSIHI
jgi:hypothetical protein